MNGKLLIVATPLGNLGDFSPRAIEALTSADLILCEDTRRTRKLLTHFRIEKKVESFHEHNEDEKSSHMIDTILAGKVVALVSDAGTPVVSDPGFRLVRIARERGAVVEPIPGPFAGVMALAASGIAPQPFTFFGFAPHRHGERTEFYRRVAAAGHTAIVYESPERVEDSLRDALTILGDVEVTVAREMTKLHEEFVHGLISEVVDKVKAKGEITLIFAAPKEVRAAVSPQALRSEFERLRAEGMQRNDALKVIAEKFGLRKNEIYKLLVE
jgi:16S rRNA (cytidine1402-2'-O)-methyltransferase